MSTRHEILVALRVGDDAEYDRYRAAMKPLLHARGGRFTHDYRIADVLEGEPGTNRVFVISFPDRETHDAFFADPDYLAARATHFDAAVRGGDVIARWDA
jgi:uncharacterized protein (DUF1330 family)